MQNVSISIPLDVWARARWIAKTVDFDPILAILVKMAENSPFSAILLEKCPSGTGKTGQNTRFDTLLRVPKPFYFLQ